MAAAMIGSAFLYATVQTLVEKLASKEFLDYIKNTKLDVSLLKQLRLTLLTLQPVLDAAEEKQINTPSVKDWLDGLKDAVYDAEDLLNQISYDSLRCKMEHTQAANNTNQVWNFISSPFKNTYGEINTQMKDMCESLKLFADHKDILISLQTKSIRVSHRAPSCSMVNDSDMVGRTDDQEKVISMLLSLLEKLDFPADLSKKSAGNTFPADFPAVYGSQLIPSWVIISAEKSAGKSAGSVNLNFFKPL